jgi:hypothetical protein
MQGAPNLFKSCTRPSLGFYYSFEGSKKGVRAYGQILANPRPPLFTVYFFVHDLDKQEQKRRLMAMMPSPTMPLAKLHNHAGQGEVVFSDGNASGRSFTSTIVR